MKLKKVFALVLVAVSAFSLAACSSSAPAADGGKSGACLLYTSDAADEL